MSVRTTADEKRDEAKEHINEAYKCLLAAIDTNTWGANEFNSKYLAIMEEALIRLIQIKRDL